MKILFLLFLLAAVEILFQESEDLADDVSSSSDELPSSPQRYGLGFSPHSQSPPGLARVHLTNFVKPGFDAQKVVEPRISSENPATRPNYFDNVSPPPLSEDILKDIFVLLPLGEDKARFRSVCRQWNEAGKDVDLSNHQRLRANEVRYGREILRVLSQNPKQSLDYFMENPSDWIAPDDFPGFLRSCQRFLWLRPNANPKKWTFDDVRKVVYGLYMS